MNSFSPSPARKSWSARTNKSVDSPRKTRAFTISVSEPAVDIEQIQKNLNFSKEKSHKAENGIHYCVLMLDEPNFLDNLTDDLLAEVFSFLLPEHLTRIARVIADKH
jgi:hypothetical protein